MLRVRKKKAKIKVKNPNGETAVYIPEKHGISQSLMEEWRKCYVRARFIFTGWHKPSESEAIIFGSAFHQALDVIYNATKENVVFDQTSLMRFIELNQVKMFDPLREDYVNSDSKVKQIVEDSCRRTIIMIPLYFRYHKNDFGINWAGIEKMFTFPIGKMFWRGKRDGELWDSNNKMWLFETKTKSRYTLASIMKWLKKQLQVNSYLWSLHVDYKTEPVGVLYNIIRSPLIRKTQSMTWAEYKETLQLDIRARPEFYFQRIEMAMPFVTVKKFFKALTKEVERFYTWFYDDPENDMPCGGECEGKYGMCKFIDACNSNNFHGLEKRTNLFPEL